MGTQHTPDREWSSAKALTAVVYVLYAIGSVTFVTTFVAITINYIQKDAVKGTWLESHFRWQVQTFWMSVVGILAGLLLMVAFVGLFIVVAVQLWMLYRIVRGVLNLVDGKAMDANG